MEVNLPDGSKQELPEESSVIGLARKIKKQLNGNAIAAKINGELKELNTVLNNGDNVQVLTFDDEEGKAIFWHSSAHLLAEAVINLFPEAKPTIGPAIENGFYYDFDLPRTLIPEDLPLLEKKMKQIVKQNQKFISRVEPIDESIKMLKKAGEIYKLEMASDLKEEGEKEISFSIGGNKSEVVRVKAGIFTIKGFSGHSSRPQLMAFLRNCEPKPRRVITNHGESSKCLDLASSVHKAMKIETSVPRNLDALRLV